MTMLDCPYPDAATAAGAYTALADGVLGLPLSPTARAALLAEAAAQLRSATGPGRIRAWVEGRDDVSMRGSSGSGPCPAVDQIIAPLLEVIADQETALRWHQDELQQTNTGLVALHSQLDEQRRRQGFLDLLSRETAHARDTAEVFAALRILLRQEGLADDARIWIPQGDGELRCRFGVTGSATGIEPVAETLRGGMPIQDGPNRALLPLVLGPRRLAVLDLVRPDRPYGEVEQEFGREIGNRLGVALRTAEEYERERELAAALQRAMLPTIPVADGFELCAHYRPATDGLNVGGDWYDAFTRPDGTVVMAIGDVTGHGVDAAVLMGQLQNTLRAYAVEGHPPATVLRLLHELLAGQNTTRYATALVVRIRPDGTVDWAGAGHPPPVVLRPDGHGTILHDPQAPMLGLPIEMRFPEYRFALPAGAALALYTDGLVERRDSIVDTGIDRLAAIPLDPHPGRLGDTARRILDVSLDSGAHMDDVCLLLCARPPEARPSIRPGMRTAGVLGP